MEIIENMNAAQIPACVQIMLANPLFQRYGFNAERAHNMFTMAVDEGASILTLKADQQTVGFVWLALRGAWERSGYIRLIAVLPQYQGSGFGKALMDAAEGELAAHVREVFLLVSDFNIVAQHFYQGRGYVQVGAIPNYLVQGIDELIYYKRLPEVP